MTWLAIAVGGGLGSVARYAIGCVGATFAGIAVARSALAVVARA